MVWVGEPGIAATSISAESSGDNLGGLCRYGRHSKEIKSCAKSRAVR